MVSLPNLNCVAARLRRVEVAVVLVAFSHPKVGVVDPLKLCAVPEDSMAINPLLVVKVCDVPLKPPSEVIPEPVPPPTHVFPIEKHPVAIFMPPWNDEVAVPRTLMEPVAVRPATVVVPKRTEPCTERSEAGVVVPMPTLLLVSMTMVSAPL